MTIIEKSYIVFGKIIKTIVGDDTNNILVVNNDDSISYELCIECTFPEILESNALHVNYLDFNDIVHYISTSDIILISKTEKRYKDNSWMVIKVRTLTYNYRKYIASALSIINI